MKKKSTAASIPEDRDCKVKRLKEMGYEVSTHTVIKNGIEYTVIRGTRKEEN